jgi:head-tail adaptor
MRAGSLDRIVEIQSPTETISEAGVPVTVWSHVATMRAQMLQFDTSNREGQHTTSDTTITFRCYYLDGVTLEHRVLYLGEAFKIQKIKELGRRAGLDLIVEKVGQ